MKIELDLEGKNETTIAAELVGRRIVKVLCSSSGLTLELDDDTSFHLSLGGWDDNELTVDIERP